MSQKQWLAAGLFLLTVACFGRACWCEFVLLDDPLYVTDNPHVLTGLTSGNMSWAFSDSCLYIGMWLPLTWVSLQADATLFGPTGAFGFHLTNVLLHAAVVVLFFLFLIRVTGAVWCSAAAAALFAVHPLRVESVAWVTERKDVLSALFLVLALLAYFRYTRAPTRGRYGLVVACYAAGLMTKPSLVTLPFGLLLLDYWPLYRLRLGQVVPQELVAVEGVGWKRLVLEKVPLLGLSIAISVCTYYFKEYTGVLDVEGSEAPQPLAVALSGYLSYLEQTFWPVNLGVMYPLRSPSVGRIVLALAVLASVTIVLVCLARRRPEWIVGWCWFLGMLVPNSGVVQVGPQAFADRFTYVPHLYLMAGIVYGINGLSSWQRLSPWLRKGLVAVSVLILCALSWNQIGCWKNSHALFAHALSVTEDNIRMHSALANYYMKKEDPVHAEEQYDLALDSCERLGQFPIDYAFARYYKGRFLIQRGDRSKGREHLQAALERWTAHPSENSSLQRDIVNCTADAYQAIGEIDLVEGQPEQSLAHFAHVFELRPKDGRALLFACIALMRLERWTSAESAMNTLLATDAGNALMRGYLAQTYTRQNKKDQAAKVYTELQTRFPQWAERTNDLAMTMITNPRVLDATMAEELAGQICEATDFHDPRWLDTLAATQAARGNFAKAKQTANIALRLASDPALIRQLQERLGRYERGEALPLVD